MGLSSTVTFSALPAIREEEKKTLKRASKLKLLRIQNTNKHFKDFKALFILEKEQGLKGEKLPFWDSVLLDKIPSQHPIYLYTEASSIVLEDIHRMVQYGSK